MSTEIQLIARSEELIEFLSKRGYDNSESVMVLELVLVTLWRHCNPEESGRSALLESVEMCWQMVEDGQRAREKQA